MPLLAIAWRTRSVANRTSVPSVRGGASQASFYMEYVESNRLDRS